MNPSDLEKTGPRWTTAHRDRALVFPFFVVYLVLGSAIYADYGFSFDELTSHINGECNYDYLINGNKEILQASSEKHHGPAFEITLLFLEKYLKLKDARDVYLMRHLVTFLLFYAAVFVFYG